MIVQISYNAMTQSYSMIISYMKSYIFFILLFRCAKNSASTIEQSNIWKYKVENFCKTFSRKRMAYSLNDFVYL